MMIDLQNIENVLIQKFPDSQYVKVSCEQGTIHVKVVCDIFEGKSQVKRHQMIYDPLMPYIKDGSIHSIALYAYTKAEWSNLEDKK